MSSPSGEYYIKRLASNVTYTWEGARIGNTSDSLTGSTKHRLFEPIRGIVVNGTTAYVASGYSEAWPPTYRFNTTSLQRKTWIGRMGKTDAGTDFAVTDGNRVYWAGYDLRDITETLVYATNVSNDQLVAMVLPQP